MRKTSKVVGQKEKWEACEKDEDHPEGLKLVEVPIYEDKYTCTCCNAAEFEALTPAARKHIIDCIVFQGNKQHEELVAPILAACEIQPTSFLAEPALPPSNDPQSNDWTRALIVNGDPSDARSDDSISDLTEVNYVSLLPFMTSHLP